MRIISHPSDFDVSDLYVDLSSLFGVRLLVKCEGFNFAASIKLKPARHMIAAAEADGALAAGRCLIESSSGNLGVALAMIAAERGYLRNRCKLQSRGRLRVNGARGRGSGDGQTSSYKRLSGCPA